MNDYPQFMKKPENAIAAEQQSPGAEGYVFDGIEGSQMAVFTCSRDGLSKEHVHPFDEYFLVVQGKYTLGIEGRKITLKGGEEYHIPQGIAHDGAFIAGTRTIHAFGGRRAERKLQGGS